MSNTPLIVTAAAGAVLLIVLCGLYTFLLVRKHNQRTYKRARERWKTAMEQPGSALQAYIAEGRRLPELVPRKQLHYDALEEMLSHRLKLACSASEKERIYQFAGEYFADLYRARLRSGRWSVRMNTLLYIEMFRMKVLEPDLLAYLNHRSCSRQETYTIYRVLAVFEYAGVHDLLERDGQLPSYVYRQMLYPLPMSVLERYLQAFDQAPPWIQCHLLDVLRVRNERTLPLLELLERLLDSEQGELRIRALKGLAAFAYMTEESLNRLHASFDLWSQRDWPERLMLARLLGSIREERFLPQLEYLISDEVYLVRSEAAASISMYRSGQQQLEWITHHHTDRFAREMAAERLGL